MGKFIVKTFTSVFGLGYLPIAPGTWGTLGAFVLWLVWMRHLSVRPFVFIVALIIVFGYHMVDIADKKIYKKKDSPHIVIDEVAGYLVSMIGTYGSLYWGIAGFILFRIFDIWKPYPINRTQSWKGGLGIMADDVAAGIYVMFILNVADSLSHYFNLNI